MSTKSLTIQTKQKMVRGCLLVLVSVWHIEGTDVPCISLTTANELNRLMSFAYLSTSNVKHIKTRYPPPPHFTNPLLIPEVVEELWEGSLLIAPTEDKSSDILSLALSETACLSYKGRIGQLLPRCLDR